jgi:hypothetical protein
VLPPGLLFWLVIHPWARAWRRLGPIRTYLIVLLPVIAFGAVLFRVRGRLLGADLGLSWSLIVGNAPVIDHVGMYVLIPLSVTAGSVMLRFEERELLNRLGDEYRQYQNEAA